MEVHKPKPAHSWREFLTEIGTIILGILIALGLEQIAEAAHWRHKIEQAQHAMRLELVEDDGPQAFARLAAVACFEGQLDAIEKFAAPGSDRAALHAAALAYDPPGRTWDQQAWQAAVASDVGTHMGAEEQIRWAGPYHVMAGLEQGSLEEMRNKVALTAVAGTQGVLSEAEADRARGLIASLRAENVHQAGAGMVVLQALRDAGMQIGQADRRDIMNQARARFGACARDPETILARRGTLAVDDKRQFEASQSFRALLGLTPLK